MTRTFDADFWDERYNSANAVWSGHPNPQLVAEAASLNPLHVSAPRTALDVGSGEGADALWLADRGWNVTAVDFSRVALQRAKEHASAMDLAGSVIWEHHDLLIWTPPASTFDLVSAQFMHLPRTDRERLYAHLAASVAIGGTLLIVGHSATDALAGAHRPDAPDLFFTAAELAAALEPTQWRIQVSEARPRAGTGHDHASITIHDEVLRAIRLS
ncbi:class I SAM-dependent methyltransferase [Arthrobacter sp. lap29]|uniref:class I SAM-dependent methyltransferase n=1 Tax=Arthrobacter sp. lap29 TaxID=3056122 RepID=UPI0028F6D00E|nr:class I SAM-dependent methyltransferase [Arthrobacter sp. lap29]